MFKFLVSKIAAPIVGKVVDTVGREIGLIKGKTSIEKIDHLVDTLRSLQDDRGCFCRGVVDCTVVCMKAQEVVKAYVS